MIKRYCKKYQNNEFCGLLVLAMYYVCNKFLRKNWNLPLKFEHFDFFVRPCFFDFYVIPA